MTGRKVLIYFSWSRPRETEAPLTVIDDRFPAMFELRRLFYPRYEELADTARVDQGIGGFLDHVQKPNFAAFAQLAGVETGCAAVQIERVTDTGAVAALDESLVSGFDTIVVIGFDSLVTRQSASAEEVEAVRGFLADPDHFIAICPHHDIGQTEALMEHLHHGDRAIPPRQAFGGFARTLLAGLGAPVENRFGLKPAARADGSPAALDIERRLDRRSLLEGVETFNLHPHLPHLERIGASADRLSVLARQRIDLSAPPHPFTQEGRDSFDALLQSSPGTFAGTLWVGDTTLWSSTAGGLESLQRLWRNVLQRPKQ